MKNLVERLGVTALFALALFAFSIHQASADVEEVDCNDGDSIQGALDAAEDGDVIEVKGACVENVTVRGFNITLRGLPGASITAADDDKDVIAVRGIDARIEDWDLISGGRNGISLSFSASATIARNKVVGAADHGIVVNRSAFATIDRNEVLDNVKVGIKIMKSGSADLFNNTVSGTKERLTGGSGHGIMVNLGASADLEGNTSTGNAADGLRVQETSAVRLRTRRGRPPNPNKFEGNERHGVHCRTNSSIDVTTKPDFGTGNTSGNISLAGSCVVDSLT